MSELKACPFCGAENTDVGFIAHTDDCYLMRRYIGASSRKELGIAWNTRPIEDELRAEIARRDAALNELLLLIEEHGAEHIRSHAKQIWKIRMYAKDEETFIRKSVADELARRDEIIARLKEAGNNMYFTCSDDPHQVVNRVHDAWRALMKELE